MNINQAHIIVPKTAKYSIVGELSSKTKYLWLVLHGYGHLSAYFIRKFRTLCNEETVIVAPEALHRFYLNGSEGRVGASWMTKEEREYDIKDYLQYLDLLIDNVLKNHPENLKILALGFSQGGATLSRWICNTKHPLNAYILWASVFPPDMQMDKLPANLKGYFIAGNQDEYLKSEQINSFQNFIKENGLNLSVESFQGNHSIPENVLHEMSQRIYSNLSSSQPEYSNYEKK
jgi:predicted esterase